MLPFYISYSANLNSCQHHKTSCVPNMCAEIGCAGLCCAGYRNEVSLKCSACGHVQWTQEPGPETNITNIPLWDTEFLHSSVLVRKINCLSILFQFSCSSSDQTSRNATKLLIIPAVVGHNLPAVSGQTRAAPR